MKARALLSVTDKSEIDKLAKFLTIQGYEIISSGGTGKYLNSKDIPFTPIEKVTGYGEAFGGRMKTLSFEIESAILFNREKDVDEAKKYNIIPIDVVVCNFYPFIEKSLGLNEDEIVELIDVGGPTMLRAAAKNYKYVTALSHPSQYEEFIKVSNLGFLTKQLRRKWAVDAFELSANYEAFIFKTLNQNLNPISNLQFEKKDFDITQSVCTSANTQSVCMPANIQTVCTSANIQSVSRPEKVQELRYGENPHQKAWLIKDLVELAQISLPSVISPIGVAGGTVLGGKELSYNNILDVDSAWRLVSDLKLSFSELKSVVVIKHLNPCGMTTSPHLYQSLELAWETDTVSRFGGIIAMSEPVTQREAEFLKDQFIEVLMAPGFTDEALDILKLKKNLRLIACPLKQKKETEISIKSVSGGFLIQEEDEKYFHEIQSVTQLEINSSDIRLADFANIAVKHLKSNALALVERNENVFNLVASGMGQPNRVDCLDKLIKWRSLEVFIRRGIEPQNIKLELEKMILASDAFFPFSDIVELAHELGIKKIIQPGGSVRDAEIIKKCNELCVAMAFTGIRHFRH